MGGTKRGKPRALGEVGSSRAVLVPGAELAASCCHALGWPSERWPRPQVARLPGATMHRGRRPPWLGKPATRSRSAAFCLRALCFVDL